MKKLIIFTIFIIIFTIFYILFESMLLLICKTDNIKTIKLTGTVLTINNFDVLSKDTINDVIIKNNLKLKENTELTILYIINDNIIIYSPFKLPMNLLLKHKNTNTIPLIFKFNKNNIEYRKD